MKCVLLFASLGLLPSLCLPAPMVRLLNGDRLEGETVELREGILHVRSPRSPTPLRIPAQYIGYSFHAPDTAPAGGGALLLTLRNGDRLRADLRGVDADTLELQSSWGQTLRLSRPALESFHLSPPPARILLESPRDIEAWTISGQSRQDVPPLEFFPEGLSLPLRNGLTYRLPSHGKPFQLRFRAGSEHPHHLTVQIDAGPGRRRDQTATMRFMFTGNSVQYQYHHPTDPMGLQRWAMERDPRDTPQRGFSSEYAIYAHPERGEALMLWDGELVQRWTLPLPLRETPNLPLDLGIHLQHQRSPVLLGSVELHPWDGIDPHPPEHLDRVPPPRLTLRNRDLLHAELSGWEEEHFILERPDAGSIRLRPDQLLAYQADASGEPPFRSHRRDVRVRLVGGEILTLALLDLTEERLVGQSDAWAEPLLIPLGRVVSIHWNIHTRLRWDQLPSGGGHLY